MHPPRSELTRTSQTALPPFLLPLLCVQVWGSFDFSCLSNSRCVSSDSQGTLPRAVDSCAASLLPAWSKPSQRQQPECSPTFALMALSTAKLEPNGFHGPVAVINWQSCNWGCPRAGADPGGQVPCSNPGLDPAGTQGCPLCNHCCTCDEPPWSQFCPTAPNSFCQAMKHTGNTAERAGQEEDGCQDTAAGWWTGLV